MKDCEQTRGPNDWDLDFSFELLRALYGLIRKDYRPALLGDAPSELEKGGRIAFIRHDLDVNLSRARDLAEFEASLGLKTTYHVMLTSPFYDPKADSERAHLLAIAKAGHEIGLHFDATVANDRLEAEIDAQCMRLGEIIGTEVHSFSFHIPGKWPEELWKGVPSLAGRVNGYGKDLFPKFYLSDSCGRWREGDPRVSVTKPKGEVLQLLVHPIWWAEDHLAPPDRLGAFVTEVARDKGISFEEASQQVYEHILIRARKPATS